MAPRRTCSRLHDAAVVGAGLAIAASLGVVSPGRGLLRRWVSAACLGPVHLRPRVSRVRPVACCTAAALPRLSRLGLRNAVGASRPKRADSSAVIAAATFILISVDAFRRDAPDAEDPLSGVGGYSLIVETLLPIVHDVSTSAGVRRSTSATRIQRAFSPSGFGPGDDASCLNLYRPQNPRILGARADFLVGRTVYVSDDRRVDRRRARESVAAARTARA